MATQSVRPLAFVAFTREAGKEGQQYYCRALIGYLQRMSLMQLMQE